MNPTDDRGLVSGQPAGGSATPPANGAEQGQKPIKMPSELEVTLGQLTKLMHQYAEDPYVQAREIERLKAAYLAKEFGRVMKVPEN